MRTTNMNRSVGFQVPADGGERGGQGGQGTALALSAQVLWICLPGPPRERRLLGPIQGPVAEPSPQLSTGVGRECGSGPGADRPKTRPAITQPASQLE